jgi:hypothetical protein
MEIKSRNEANSRLAKSMIYNDFAGAPDIFKPRKLNSNRLLEALNKKSNRAMPSKQTSFFTSPQNSTQLVKQASATTVLALPAVPQSPTVMLAIEAAPSTETAVAIMP